MGTSGSYVQFRTVPSSSASQSAAPVGTKVITMQGCSPGQPELGVLCGCGSPQVQTQRGPRPEGGGVGVGGPDGVAVGVGAGTGGHAS